MTLLLEGWEKNGVQNTWNCAKHLFVLWSRQWR